MSKRLQVVMTDDEYTELEAVARERGMTVSAWVRRALALARRREPHTDTGRKLSAIREATRYAYPAPDIDQMLEEIERGYGGTGET